MSAPHLTNGLSILLVEDHHVFADVLAERLRAEPSIGGVEVAYSLSEARSAVGRIRPDVVLLDFQLAEECGLDLLQDIDRLPERPDVLVLSGLTDTGRIVEALEAGVQGWISKEASVEILVSATAQVQQGNMYLSPPTIRPVLEQLLNEARGDGPRPSFVDPARDRRPAVPVGEHRPHPRATPPAPRRPAHHPGTGGARPRARRPRYRRGRAGDRQRRTILKSSSTEPPVARKRPPIRSGVTT
jgi:DNA-binding NarL/FixJ family response regulator